MAKGSLLVNVYAGDIANPIENAAVHIVGKNTDITLATDSSGQTNIIELDAPENIYSLRPQHEVLPFSTYTIRVSKEGFVDTVINGAQIYPDVESIQDVYLFTKEETSEPEHVINIDPPTIWDPPRVRFQDSGADEKISFVLPQVLVPEYIIVHNGAPTNTSAATYYVSFADYIKNVASSEIYSTWPTETIKANVHAIVSFTLNRIFTEWYRSKGYNFTITSLPAYDQKYTHGRTIFETISKVVDEYFTQYIRIGSQIQPLLAHYNDGITTNNPGWLSQWGSKDLGESGYTSLQIIRYYYGSGANLNSAPVFENYPSSFPGYNLKLGSCGEPVQKMQNELNIIRGNYPAIPVITNPNGIFDSETEAAVKKFQSIFSLTSDGIVGFATWYKISYIFTAVSNFLKSTFTA